MFLLDVNRSDQHCGRVQFHDVQTAIRCAKWICAEDEASYAFVDCCVRIESDGRAEYLDGRRRWMRLEGKP